MFVHCNNKIVNSDSISWIDYVNLVKHGYIRLHYKYDLVEIVEGSEAVAIVMELCPAALEGKRAKYIRHAWAAHNLIGHPLMQIFTWLHLTRLAIWIHDVTVPEPQE